MPNHNVAVKLVLNKLTDSEVGVISSMSEIDGVGHRVVASGEAFKKPTLVTRVYETYGGNKGFSASS